MILLHAKVWIPLLSSILKIWELGTRTWNNNFSVGKLVCCFCFWSEGPHVNVHAFTLIVPNVFTWFISHCAPFPLFCLFFLKKLQNGDCQEDLCFGGQFSTWKNRFQHCNLKMPCLIPYKLPHPVLFCFCLIQRFVSPPGPRYLLWQCFESEGH